MEAVRTAPSPAHRKRVLPVVGTEPGCRHNPVRTSRSSCFSCMQHLHQAFVFLLYLL
jgi:hypothetical protein